MYRSLVDAGEAEAIQLPKELNADHLLIDDFKCRRLAEREGVHAIGLLGVLLLSKLQGHLTAIGPLIDRLQREAHVYLSKDVVASVLSQAGE